MNPSVIRVHGHGSSRRECWILYPHLNKFKILSCFQWKWRSSRWERGKSKHNTGNSREKKFMSKLLAPKERACSSLSVTDYSGLPQHCQLCLLLPFDICLFSGTSCHVFWVSSITPLLHIIKQACKGGKVPVV